MSKPVALISGARGEMGHALLPLLRECGHELIAIDLEPLEPDAAALCREAVTTSILDTERMAALFRAHRPTAVYHLAAVLSKKAEADPWLAQRVNVGGTASLLELSEQTAAETGRDVAFFFPSSIAVYGLEGREAKRAAGAVREDEALSPAGMYGCNKLASELLGRYLTGRGRGIDFRSIRFPGLISADTLPTGGTTDYAPEMLHAAAQAKPYICFVEAATRLPFMTMPDAIGALLRLMEAPVGRLSRRVYNIRGFSPTAGEIREAVLQHYPTAAIDFEPDPARQALVDGWPADVDDGAARHDWGLAPDHDLERALSDYLVPALRRRYDAVPS